MTPGRGFSWVRVGETLRDTDEFSVKPKEWVKTEMAGEVVEANTGWVNWYRRRTATRKTKGRA